MRHDGTSERGPCASPVCRCLDAVVLYSRRLERRREQEAQAHKASKRAVCKRREGAAKAGVNRLVEADFGVVRRQRASTSPINPLQRVIPDGEWNQPELDGIYIGAYIFGCTVGAP